MSETAAQKGLEDNLWNQTKRGLNPRGPLGFFRPQCPHLYTGVSNNLTRSLESEVRQGGQSSWLSGLGVLVIRDNTGEVLHPIWGV